MRASSLFLGRRPKKDAPPLGVGRGSVIGRAIIDKNVRIGDNVVIRARPDAKDLKGDLCWIRDGITDYHPLGDRALISYPFDG